MANHLKESPTLWDMGISDLLEETPASTEGWPNQFRVVKEKNESNLYLIRREPSWKSSPTA